MSDNNRECYGKLVSEVLTAITQVYWGKMYKYVKENQYEQKVYVINTHRGAVESLDTTAQGAHWDGETDILIRLIQPLSQKLPDGKMIDLPQHNIPWNFFTLQDAIEFAEFATKVTIDTMKFQERVKTVGGPIDIMVLKPNSHQWISHKELHIQFHIHIK